MTELEPPYVHKPLEIFTTFENDRSFYFHSDQTFVHSQTVNFFFSYNNVLESKDHAIKLQEEGMTPIETIQELKDQIPFGHLTWLLRKAYIPTDEANEALIRDTLINSAKKELEGLDSLERWIRENIPYDTTGTTRMGDRNLLNEALRLLTERTQPSSPAMKK